MHALEFPVCIFDLKTGILCAKCEDKLSRGELTKLDFDIMRFFLELEKNNPQLASLSYVRSIKIDDHLFVLFKKKDTAGLSPTVQAQLKKILSDKFGLNVRIVEEHKDFNTFIQNLTTPARILAVNKVWLPDQTTEIKVVLEDDRVLKTPLEVISEAIRQLKGISVSFEVQRRERPAVMRFRR